LSEHRSDESKTEQPTERRLAKAREEGMVPRAHGVAAAAVLLSGAGILSLGGGKLVELLELTLRRGLSFEADRLQDPAGLAATLSSVVTPAILVVVIFLVAMAAVGFAADILVGGWSFSVHPLNLDLGRLSLARGLQQLVSRTALLETAKSLVKLALVGTISFLLVRAWAPGFFGVASETWPRAAGDAALLWSRIFLILSAVLAAIAVVEVPYQIWSYRNRLKMTRQEVKDEFRELDGSPHTKRRIKLLRRRFARMRMAAEVPKADVVVTNPEHYAAALRYQEGKMRAPRLVAKGSGLVAHRIRAIAAEHRVPIIEAPPLARAICRFVELEDEIPAGLYPPVAEVLAYVYRLRAADASGKRHTPLPQDRRFEPPPELAVMETRDG
jgi:flagellar biosynthesis protein FlhB